MAVRIPLVPLARHREVPQGFSEAVPWGIEIEPGIYGHIDGALSSSWRIYGPDMTGVDQAVAKAHKRGIALGYNLLSEGWMLQTHFLRSQAGPYPLTGRFSSAAGWIVEQERIAQHAYGGQRFLNDVYQSLTYLPPPDEAKGEKRYYSGEGDPPAIGDKHLIDFKKRISEVTALLTSEISMERLAHSERFVPGEGFVTCDDYAAFLNRLLWNENQPIRRPPDGAHIASYVAVPIKTQPFFIVGNDVVAIITLDDVPPKARTTILDRITGIPAAYGISWRWIVREKDIIVKEMTALRKKQYSRRLNVAQQLGMSNVPWSDQAAVDHAADVHEAIGEASQDIAYGYHSFALTFRERIQTGEDPARAAERLNEAVTLGLTALRSAFFVPRLEKDNPLDAWMATLVGMGYAGVRKGITGSMQSAYLAPTTQVWVGQENNPCSFYPAKSPALSYTATTGAAPFWFNLHVGQVGHALLVGGTGGRKTTALNLMLLQSDRYLGSRRIAFDKGRSMEPTIRAMDGTFIDFSPESGIRLAPFARVGNKREHARIAGFVQYLLEVNGVRSEPHRADIAQALLSLADNAKVKPSMTAFIAQGFVSKQVKDVLQAYTLGNAGDILDGDEEMLPNASTICFELETVLNLKDALRKPILYALLEQIEIYFDGRPTLFIIDEAWRMLNDDLLAPAIEEKIKTARRSNVAMVFATQELRDLETQIGRCLKSENILTRIFTPNYLAKTELLAKQLRENLDLKPWEIEEIAGMPPGDYYLVQERHRRRFSFDLGPVALCFAGATDRKNGADRVRAMLAEDLAYEKTNGVRTPRPWQARWIEAQVGGQHGKEWATHYLSAKRDPAGYIPSNL